jgi:hypothetical protein
MNASASSDDDVDHHSHDDSDCNGQRQGYDRHNGNDCHDNG